MIDALISHSHRPAETAISRAPAALKLTVALAIIITTVVIPVPPPGWFAGVALLLITVTWLGRVSPLFLLKRVVLLSPLILGVAAVNSFQPGSRLNVWTLALKSSVCLLSVMLVVQTTPFSKILKVLQRARVPSLLITTIALMHRYIFVLAEESERMRRARASRTFSNARRTVWSYQANVVGQLFIRASERAERIYSAMCARGWK